MHAKEKKGKRLSSAEMWLMKTTGEKNGGPPAAAIGQKPVKKCQKDREFGV